MTRRSSLLFFYLFMVSLSFFIPFLLFHSLSSVVLFLLPFTFFFYFVLFFSSFSFLFCFVFFSFFVSMSFLFIVSVYFLLCFISFFRVVPFPFRLFQCLYLFLFHHFFGILFRIGSFLSFSLLSLTIQSFFFSFKSPLKVGFRVLLVKQFYLIQKSNNWRAKQKRWTKEQRMDGLVEGG